MNNSHEKFRESLLGRQELSPGYQQKYREEVRAMIEEKVTGVRKWLGISRIGLDLGFAVFCLFMASRFEKHPIFSPLVWIFIAVALVLRAGAVAWIIHRGSYDPRTLPVIIQWANWCFVAFLAILMIPHGQAIADVGLLAIIAASVVLIDRLIKKGEAQTREKLLEVQYRLAVIDEKISGRQSGPGT